MTKGNSTALKVSACISFAVACLSIFTGLAIIFNWFNMGVEFNNAVVNALGGRTSSWQNTYKYMVLLETAFSSIINVYAGSVYLKISKQKDLVLGTNKLLTYMAFVQLVFTSNALSAIIVFAVAYKINIRFNTKKVQITDNDQLNSVAERIQELKFMLQTGKITQQEYDEKLNKLLEDSVKSQVKWKKE